MHFSTLAGSFAALVAIANGALVSVPNWGTSTTNPTGIAMSIWVPTKLATKPAIILALHGCLSSGASYAQQAKYGPLADTHGFIVIYPSSSHDNNCWDVASTKSLTRDGEGDSHGLANMLKYTIDKYDADPKKIFVTGSSSGGMMTNVMAAIYPDVVTAGSVYSGVAAGCLAGSPGSSPITADPACANGQHIKTSAQWVAQVKAMYPGYNGTYPKMQTWHGTADTLVLYANLGEQIKEWTGLLGGAAGPLAWTKNVTSSPQAQYTQMIYGDGTLFQAYSAVGVGHTVPVHETVDLAWFGLT
ncbi:feruloyl esterase B [Mollisia scopiformis]|uniref:Carboxylic ester hydrolase n=1 Tax=Mollisia scopiformis TaxID=149040 RepID=A0A132BC72_MOLSC|nr:feruloyl esterase B [Mollisia scopiformis]KUJ09454.1 feruloyl esterase B [Mollisia scopiformis]